MSEAQFPTPTDLLPHDPPMVLVDRVESWDGTSIVVNATLRPRHGFVDERGVASSLVCIEYMAQAIGCAEGLKRREQAGDEITVGLLLGTREMSIEVDELAAGDVLRIRATHGFSNARLAKYSCEVHRGEQRIAVADLNVFAGNEQELSP
jgi:predicted hotdog family 3-hydroxylacyl-ACP dehydratase